MARVILRLSWRGLCPGWAPYEVKQPDAPLWTDVRRSADLSTSAATGPPERDAMEAAGIPRPGFGGAGPREGEQPGFDLIT